MKITEKVSFNIASEASYVYKSGQKLIKSAKIVKKLKNSNETFSEDFQTLWSRSRGNVKCFLSRPFRQLWPVLEVFMRYLWMVLGTIEVKLFIITLLTKLCMHLCTLCPSWSFKQEKSLLRKNILDFHKGGKLFS